MAKNWIKGAINPAHKGAFKAKAKKAGKSTGAYARQVLRGDSGASHETQMQARLAQTLARIRKK